MSTISKERVNVPISKRLGADIGVTKLALLTTSPMHGMLRCDCGYVSEHHGYGDMSDHVISKHCHGFSPDGIWDDLQDVWTGKLKAVVWNFILLSPDTTERKWMSREGTIGKWKSRAVMEWVDEPSVATVAPIKEGRVKRFYDWVRKRRAFTRS